MKTSRLLVFVAAAAALSAHAQSDPRAAALNVYKVLQRQDWRGLYYVVAFSPKVMKQMPGPDKFGTDVAQGIRNSGSADVVDRLFRGMTNIKVGAAKVMGYRATVPTSSTITMNGKKNNFHGLARMIKVGKVWKWDLTTTDDPKTATSTALQELLGRPG